MIKRKLYYTDKLKVEWMKREFGVKFREPVLGDAAYSDLNANPRLASEPDDDGGYRVIYDHIRAEREEYYIHPDSLHIFEPQEGNLCLKEDRAICHYCGMAHYCEWDEDCDDAGYKVKEIIPRGGKQFFMPEIENDKA